MFSNHENLRAKVYSSTQWKKNETQHTKTADLVTEVKKLDWGLTLATIPNTSPQRVLLYYSRAWVQKIGSKVQGSMRNISKP